MILSMRTRNATTTKILRLIPSVACFLPLRWVLDPKKQETKRKKPPWVAVVVDSQESGLGWESKRRKGQPRLLSFPVVVVAVVALVPVGIASRVFVP